VREELAPERSAVSTALLKNDLFPMAMELFPAADERSISLIERMIRDSDYFLIVAAKEYGSKVPKTHKSYTEFEYECARRLNKKIIAFIKKDCVDEEYLDSCSRSSDPDQVRQGRFIRKLMGRSYLPFGDPADLGHEASNSIRRVIMNSPEVGWVRADAPGFAHVSQGQDRIHFYQSLRKMAKSSIFVAGVAMRNISTDLRPSIKMLRNGGRMRLLCLNPDFVRRKRLTSVFDDYFGRKMYLEDVKISIKRMKEFIRDVKTEKLSGKVELRVYDSLPAGNLTCIDEDTDHARLIFECIAYKNHRLKITDVTKQSEFYEPAYEIFDKLWKSSKIVAKSR
jgi:hypothetical protein